jgi:hypothetical protein
MFCKKLADLMEIPMTNLDFSENLITRGSIYEQVLTRHTPSEEPSEVFFSKHVGFQKSNKTCGQICFPEMSGIDFPGLGTLRLAIGTAYFFVSLQYVLDLFDRFLTHF